jgi:hypothetical protein
MQTFIRKQSNHARCLRRNIAGLLQESIFAIGGQIGHAAHAWLPAPTRRAVAPLAAFFGSLLSRMHKRSLTSSSSGRDCDTAQLPPGASR